MIDLVAHFSRTKQQLVFIMKFIPFPDPTPVALPVFSINPDHFAE